MKMTHKSRTTEFSACMIFMYIRQLKSEQKIKDFISFYFFCQNEIEVSQLLKIYFYVIFSVPASHVLLWEEEMYRAENVLPKVP